MCIYIYINLLIALVGRVFANGLGDLGSFPGCVIPKTLKWYLIPPCLTLSNIRSVSRVKWSNPGKGVVPSSISRCCSYWKGSLWVALDYSRQLTYICICMYMYMYIIFFYMQHAIIHLSLSLVLINCQSCDITVSVAIVLFLPSVPLPALAIEQCIILSHL